MFVCTQNLEYAQTLLVRLEQLNTTSQPTRASRQQTQNTTRQRDILKQCGSRLREIDLEASVGTTDGTSDEDTKGDDTQELLRRFAPVANRSAAIDPAQVPTSEPKSALNSSFGPPQVNATATPQSSNLRPRRLDPISAAAQPAKPAVATSSSSQISPFAPKSTSSTTVLDTHTSTQEDLTTSLLDLARALNASTKSFSTSLEASNPLVDSATSALDRNVTGMEAAERRMGMLRRMTEGKGWFGRLSLWAWIAVGWVALLVVMFILPKLRL